MYVVNIGLVHVSSFKILVLRYFGSRLLHLFLFVIQTTFADYNVKVLQHKISSIALFHWIEQLVFTSSKVIFGQ